MQRYWRPRSDKHQTSRKRQGGAGEHSAVKMMNTVEPPLTATSPQRPLFLVDSPYIDSCFNVSTMVTFFCPQGGRCRDVQLYQRALDSRTRTTRSTTFSQYRVLLTREPASFWRENVIAVVILLRVLARMSQWREQVIKCEKFFHFAIGRGRNKSRTRSPPQI